MEALGKEMSARSRRPKRRGPELPRVSEKDASDKAKMLQKARAFYAFPVPGGFEAPSPELYIDGMEYEHVWPQIEMYLEALMGQETGEADSTEDSGDLRQRSESAGSAESDGFAGAGVGGSTKARAGRLGGGFNSSASSSGQEGDVDGDVGASGFDESGESSGAGDASSPDPFTGEETSGAEDGEGGEDASSHPDRSGHTDPSDPGEEDEENEEGEEDEEEFAWDAEIDDDRAAEIEAEILAASELEAAEEGEEGEEDEEGDGAGAGGAGGAGGGRRSRRRRDRDDASSSAQGPDPDDPNLTEYERAQLRLREKIAAVEREMMGDKHFTMKGEITAADRGRDALLREGAQLDFDIRKRPILVLTEELNAEIEALIKLRVRDRVFDNPVYVSGGEELPAKKAEEIADTRTGRTLEEDIATLPERVSGQAEKTGVRLENSEAVRKLQEECISLYADLEQELRSYTSYFTTKQ